MGNPTIHEADKLLQQTPDSFDPYVNHDLSLTRDHDNKMEFACAWNRKEDSNVNPIGIANHNLILVSRVYIVEWSYQRTEDLMASAIAESLFAQVNVEGNQHVIFDDIIDHWRTGDYISGNSGFITLENGMKQRHVTTQGWELCIQ